VDDGDAETFNVAAGDVVLGFSDGVTGNLALNDIAKIVAGCAGQPADAVAQAVADEARAAGRIADDITVVVVRLGSGEPAGEAAAAAASAPRSAPLPPAAPAAPPSDAAPADALDGMKAALGGFFQKAAGAAAENAKAAASAAAEGAKEAAAKAAKAAADKAKDAMDGK